MTLWIYVFSQPVCEFAYSRESTCYREFAKQAALPNRKEYYLHEIRRGFASDCVPPALKILLGYQSSLQRGATRRGWRVQSVGPETSGRGSSHIVLASSRTPKPAKRVGATVDLC